MRPLLILGILVPEALAQSPWINEFHYDNTGPDIGEFVEVAVPHGLTDLASLRLTLYNGGDGRPYGTPHLLDSFMVGESIGGFTFYSKAITGMQNGAPDGMSLDLGGEVVHFISYEGSFVAETGPAAGLASLDIGIAQGDGSAVGSSLGLFGEGRGPGDLLWQPLGGATPGALNHGQMLIPEPSPTVLATLAVACVWLPAHLRRRQTRPTRV